MPHTNSGMSNQPMPGARSLCTVAMKFRPVKIEEKPSTKTAAVISVTVPAVVVRVRSVEVQPVSTAPMIMEAIAMTAPIIHR